VRLGTERVKVDLLAERVRQLMDGRAEKKIFLRGDGAIQLQELLDIMDRLTEAGIQQMAIVARLPEER
jgi:biopolymer transport protein ExbD